MAEPQLTPVTPQGWQRGRGFSHGMAVDGAARVLFVAGQIAAQSGGDGLVSDDFVEQWDQCLANFKAVVAAAGGRMEQVAALRIFVTDMDEYNRNASKLGEPHRRHLGGHYPATTLVGVTGLVMAGAKIEIEGTVVIG